MKLLKKDSFDLSVIVLIAANLIPIFGVLFLDWDTFSILLLFWSENLAIGFFFILKILFAPVPHPSAHIGKLIVIPFFSCHYGIFTFVHGLFVFSIFEKDIDLNAIHGKEWPCCFVIFQSILSAFQQIYDLIPSQMRFAILALFLSHGVSFIYNFILKKEYSSKSQNLMFAPYVRVFVMHITLIAGGFISHSLGSPTYILIILVFLKIIVDVNLHLRSHRKAQRKK